MSAAWRREGSDLFLPACGALVVCGYGLGLYYAVASSRNELYGIDIPVSGLSALTIVDQFCLLFAGIAAVLLVPMIDAAFALWLAGRRGGARVLWSLLCIVVGTVIGAAVLVVTTWLAITRAVPSC